MIKLAGEGVTKTAKFVAKYSRLRKVVDKFAREICDNV